MLPLTEQHLAHYKEIFPELAPDQLETAVLYAMGIPENQIAYFISATDLTVSKTLEKVKVDIRNGFIQSLTRHFSGKNV